MLTIQEQSRSIIEVVEYPTRNLVSTIGDVIASVSLVYLGRVDLTLLGYDSVNRFQKPMPTKKTTQMLVYAGSARGIDRSVPIEVASEKVPDHLGWHLLGRWKEKLMRFTVHTPLLGKVLRYRLALYVKSDLSGWLDSLTPYFSFWYGYDFDALRAFKRRSKFLNMLDVSYLQIKPQSSRVIHSYISVRIEESQPVGFLLCVYLLEEVFPVRVNDLGHSTLCYTKSDNSSVAFPIKPA